MILKSQRVLPKASSNYMFRMLKHNKHLGSK